MSNKTKTFSTVAKHFWDETKTPLRELQRTIRSVAIARDVPDAHLGFHVSVVDAVQDVDKPDPSSNQERLEQCILIMKSLSAAAKAIPEIQDAEAMRIQIDTCIASVKLCNSYYANPPKVDLAKQDCLLSIYLSTVQNFDEKIARQICAQLGASREEDLVVVTETDIDNLKIELYAKDELKRLPQMRFNQRPPRVPVQTPVRQASKPPEPTGRRPVLPRPRPTRQLESDTNAHLAQMRACLRALPL